MTHDEKLITVRAMKKWGGSFVKSLAGTWLLADDDNDHRIQAAFPEYMASYGPGSAKFNATEQEEA